MLSKAKTCLLTQCVFSFLFSTSSAGFKSSGLLCASVLLLPLTTFVDRLVVEGYHNVNHVFPWQFTENADHRVTDNYLTFVEENLKRFKGDEEIEFNQRRQIFNYNQLKSIGEEFQKIKNDDLEKPLQKRVEQIRKDVTNLKGKIENKVLEYISKEIDGLVGELDTVKSSGINGVPKAFVEELRNNVVKLKPELLDLKSKKGTDQVHKVDSRLKTIKELFRSLKTRTSSVVFNRLFNRMKRFTTVKAAGVLEALTS